MIAKDKISSMVVPIKKVGSGRLLFLTLKRADSLSAWSFLTERLAPSDEGSLRSCARRGVFEELNLKVPESSLVSCATEIFTDYKDRRVLTKVFLLPATEISLYGKTFNKAEASFREGYNTFNKKEVQELCWRSSDELSNYVLQHEAYVPLNKKLIDFFSKWSYDE